MTDAIWDWTESEFADFDQWLQDRCDEAGDHDIYLFWITVCGDLIAYMAGAEWRA